MLTIILPLILALGTGHQCCFGAQNHESASPDGRFAVKATSLNRIRGHGPYRFRFTGEIGCDEPLVEHIDFELEWDNKKHFAMRSVVSPSGNGFLLLTSLQEALVIYGPLGHELWRLQPGDKHERLRVREVSEDSLFVDVEVITEIDGTRWTTRRARFFLPLGLAVGEEHEREPRRGAKWASVPKKERRFPANLEREARLGRALLWSEKQGEQDAARVQKLLEELDSNPADRQVVTDQLVELGSSTRFLLAERLRTDTALVGVEDRLRTQTAGHYWPHRNLDLLLALMAFPERDLAQHARDRLKRILPEGTPIDAELIRSRRSNWNWDGRRDCYVVAE